ncbi:MAG TPA: cytochrome P450 [Streptosporangiaceae bacterium]|nr:cytochrome P450 [Streptosporangiaceae bacterium]
MTTQLVRRRTCGNKMPGPPMRALPKLLGQLWRDRLSLLADAADEFGDAVRFRMGPKTIYYFNHPDHAKHVLADNPANYHKGMGLSEARRVLGDGLLTSEGALWRQQRGTIGPAFRRDRLADFAGLIVSEADALVTRLDAKSGEGPVDVLEEMTQLTIAVLGRALLGADLTRFTGLRDAFEVVQDQAMFEMVSLRMLPIWLPLPRHRRFHAALAHLEQVAARLVAEREHDGKSGGESGGENGSGDVITRLLAAYRDQPDEALRRRRLRDELLTLLLAGHETTASTLSWMWYLIDAHPEAAERMREEAVRVLGDRTPSYADLPDLRYTTMVIEETMRLYPPVWALTRRAVEADEIGGYHVPAGADVMISPYTLHRHPDYWPDPQRFDPQRFDPARTTVHRYAYIPFGAGPRVCVGSHLGMMEATFVAAMVARRFRLRLVPGRAVKGEAMLSLRVQGGLPMLVRPAAVGDTS